MKQYWYRVFALIYAALIYTISSIPSRDLPETGFPHLDKIAHLCLYGAFGLLLMPAFVSFSRISVFYAYLGSLITGGFYGISDEIHQSFVPGRTPSTADWLADMIGIILGAGFYWLFIIRRTKPVSVKDAARL